MLMKDKLPKNDKTNSCCDKMSKSGRIFRITTKKTETSASTKYKQ